ncbi:MAG TPA: glycosyltransferase family 4 protein [Candidatus Limnocylindrales bacterium]|nr:glycosyltransferase family 4 protein [Candidatus Limnocylindrales bacterium]
MALPLLFVTTYTGMGGGETSLLTLAEHLDPARWSPHLLAPADGQLPERFRAHGWPVHLIPFRGASTWFIPSVYARFPITGKITALLREQSIAAVHSDYHSLPFALPATRRTHVPLVWTCWGWWFHPKPWQRAFFQQPNAAFAASWAIRDGFLGQPPFMPPERLPVLPPGVDSSRFRPGLDGSAVRVDAGVSANAPLVAMIARFQDVKGHDVFQDMIRLIAPQTPETRFIVAGENVHGASADDAYKARILGAWQSDPLLRDRLSYLGFRVDAERVIAAADVVVCASQFESYGMVHIETMASGKPIVSTRRGGPSETVVDGETGFLVDVGDAAALADRVMLLLRDPALRQRMGAAGRARVEAQFSAQTMAAQFSAVVEGLLAPAVK